MLNQNVVKKNNIKKEILTKRHSSTMYLFWMNIDDIGKPKYTKNRLQKHASTEIGLLHSCFFNKQGNVN